MGTRTVVVLVAAGILVSLTCGFLPRLFFNDWKESAPFGDTFAVGEVVASSLALGGVIVAIVLQREELALQRKELEQTRGELQRSADAQAETVRVLRGQAAAQHQAAELQARSILVTYYLAAAERRSPFDSWSEGARKADAAAKDLERLLAKLVSDRTNAQ